MLHLGALTSAALLPPLRGDAPRQAPWPFIVRPLDATTWIIERGGGNVTVLLERGGAVLIDAKVGGAATAMAREITTRFGPVQAVIATHHHGDHSAGMVAFPGARLIAHRLAVPRIQANAPRMAEWARTVRQRLIDSLLNSLAKDFEVQRNPTVEADVAAYVDALAAAEPPRMVPDELVDDGAELRFGDSTLRVVHHGPGHTDNDIAIVDDRRKLAVVGDLLFSRHHPFIDTSAGASSTGWQSSLDAIARVARRDARVIAGHGPDTSLDGLRGQGAYFDRVRALARTARREGRSREEFMKTPEGEFAGFGFADGWSANLGVLYDEVTRSG
jgi:glyoxylase-like metal-dependent hydrolase (beta-lactamase superfamily II)